MPGIGHWPALLFVLVIVLIIWGPGKLPEIGSAVGKAMHEFRRQSSDFQDEIRRSAAPRSEPERYQSTDVPTEAASEAKPAPPPPPGPEINPSPTPDVRA
jgi:TatA/E family protein of Tat protein translocase